MSRHMVNCPSAVPGAVTTLTPTAVGIDVTVTAREQDAQRRIAGLAKLHEQPAGLPFALPHVGLRTGGSRIGYCPIVRRGATITTTLVPGGVRIHLRADSPFKVGELQDLVSARAKRLPGFASS